jgi:molybdopterin-containing oxidoreductase family iron-sulfur binding subunit
MQPVACHHCELAPCEQVCPVAATLHDAEGLNVMVYNRCVGTRYCANNCPYKVRRFNYFNYHKDLAQPANEVTKMVFNPEVTVRSRGVMEKCTFCVQRVKAVSIEANTEVRQIRDGEVQTACQQACPTRAIVFGDLADPQSEVARLAAGDRSYAMLAELNVKPRTTYLARIRNPNRKLEPAEHFAEREERGTT